MATRAQIEAILPFARTNDERRQLRGMLDHYDRITHLFNSDPNRPITLEFDEIDSDVRRYVLACVERLNPDGSFV